MKNFFQKKCITPFIAVLIAIACSMLTVLITVPIAQKETNAKKTGKLLQKEIKDVRNTDELFEEAVNDSMQADQNEIHDLVCLTKDDPNTMWKDGKVLLLTRDSFLTDYNADEKIKTDNTLWTVSAKELLNWYQKNSDQKDWELRLTQLFGQNPYNSYSDYLAVWVDPKDVYRPAFLTDPTVNKMDTTLPANTSKELRELFKENTYLAYYGDAQYPWTRLGYTYDWADNGTEYGLSEFIIRPGSEVTVAYEYDLDDFLAWMKDQTK